MEDSGAGLLHAMFLFGFFVLGIGHLEVILEGLTAFCGRSGSGRSPTSACCRRASRAPTT